MRKRIVLFGELMMRLSPEGFGRFVQADRMQVCYTGGEANAGAALANWGREVSMVSRVPAHELGDACVNYLRRYGIDTRHVQRGGERLGIFYLETGASQRQSKVIYDRQHSAFTGYDDRDVDWDAIFAGAEWFHFAGTALAVASSLLPVLQRACRAAQRQGVTVSCDLNYRAKLWGVEEAGRVMSEILPLVNVFVCGVEEASALLGVQANGDGDVAAAALSERFGFSHVVQPQREGSSASENFYGVRLWAKGRSVRSKMHQIAHIIDRVGTGDAATAGIIYGLSEGWSEAETVEFAAAAGCLKHTITGDFGLMSRDEVLQVAANSGAGRIQR